MLREGRGSARAVLLLLRPLPSPYGVDASCVCSSVLISFVSVLISVMPNGCSHSPSIVFVGCVSDGRGFLVAFVVDFCVYGTEVGSASRWCIV